MTKFCELKEGLAELNERQGFYNLDGEFCETLKGFEGSFMFWSHTQATFVEVDLEAIKDLTNPTHTKWSNGEVVSHSTYWETEKGVYRLSDHWSSDQPEAPLRTRDYSRSTADCTWCGSIGSNWWDFYKMGDVSLHTNEHGRKVRLGFCPWDGFAPNTVQRYKPLD